MDLYPKWFYMEYFCEGLETQMAKITYFVGNWGRNPSNF